MFALDARTGRLRWKWDPEVPRAAGAKACCDVVNRGVAVHRGRVYVGTLDGRLASLDAESGKVLWQTVTVDQTQSYTITGAPRVVKNKVIIGNGGGEYGVRGYVSAYDADTGKLAWRFHTVPGEPARGFESPAMDARREDVDRRMVEAGRRRHGLGFADLRLRARPALRRHRQRLALESAAAQPRRRRQPVPLIDPRVAARHRRAGVALPDDAGRNVGLHRDAAHDPGRSHDRRPGAESADAGAEERLLLRARSATGELISAAPYTEVTWAKGIDMKTGRPIETPEARYAKVEMIKPGPFGGHNWQPMSFNPGTGLVYIPALDAAFGYADDPTFKPLPGGWNLGVDLAMAAGAPGTVAKPPVGFLLAWDPVAQKERWRVPHTNMWNGGTLTTAGNLVFQGNGDGRFAAYRADTGARVWDMAVGSPIIAAPITYEIDNTQYVAVMAGYGGAMRVAAPAPPSVPGRLLVFALGGKAKLPPVTTTAMPAPAKIAVPAASSETVMLGARHLRAALFDVPRCRGGQRRSGARPEIRAARGVRSLRSDRPGRHAAEPRHAVVQRVGQRRGAGRDQDVRADPAGGADQVAPRTDTGATLSLETELPTQLEESALEHVGGRRHTASAAVEYAGFTVYGQLLLNRL